MKRFDGKDDDGGATVVRPIGMCGVDGCRQPTSIQFVYGTDPQGRLVTVIPSVMIAPGGKLRTGWTHHGWIERCGLHFSEEGMRARGEHIGWKDPEFAAIRTREKFMEACHGMPYAEIIAKRLAQGAAP